MPNASTHPSITVFTVGVRNSRPMDYCASRYIAVLATYLWPDIVFADEHTCSFSLRRRRFPQTFLAYNGIKTRTVAECFGWYKTPCFAISATRNQIRMEFTPLAEDQLHHLASSPLWEPTVSRRETIPRFSIPCAESLDDSPKSSGDISSTTPITSSILPPVLDTNFAPLNGLPPVSDGTRSTPGPIGL